MVSKYGHTTLKEKLMFWKPKNSFSKKKKIELLFNKKEIEGFCEMIDVFDWGDMVPIKFNYSEKVSTFDFPKVKFWLLIKKLLRAFAFEP